MKKNLLLKKILMSVVLLSSIPTYGATSWQATYKDYLTESKISKLYPGDTLSYVTHIGLVDLNLDGIPEVLAGYLAEVDCPTIMALSIQDNQVVKIKDLTNGISGIEILDNNEIVSRVGAEALIYAGLYWDEQRGIYKWIGHDSMKPIDNYLYHGMYEITMEQNILTSSMIFEYKQNGSEEETCYKVRGEEVSRTLYEIAYKSYYEELMSLEAYSGIVKYGCEEGGFIKTINEMIDGYHSIDLPKRAIPSVQDLIVQGKVFKLQAYQIDNSNYFKLKDLALVFRGTDLQFVMDYVNAYEYIEVSGGDYVPDGTELKLEINPKSTLAQSTRKKIALQNNFADIKVLSINGSDYVKLRDFLSVYQGSSTNIRVRDQHTIEIN